ncbi:polysaccharide deacetylase family protein [Streptomyces sp. NPDC087420]|uniref:polysaccharide deacetylase family protein n=1 Tax=Streptomyces sp. NPDC087420 TaxID=3365785 RepID=UPI00383872C9
MNVSLRRPVPGRSVALCTTLTLTLTLTVVLTVVLVLALSGCGSLNGVIAPVTARKAAAHDFKGVEIRPVDCRTAHCVALTFDGGPSRPTPRLLDILKKEKVHATFFLQGKGHTDTYPGTVARMAREGHEIANHTWSHRVLTRLDPAGIRAEVAPVQDEIQRITGHRPDLMRPPQGRTDNKVSKVMREMGLAQVLWSVTAKDYETTDTALITERVLGRARRDGVILLHDRYAGTVPAVPGIIEQLRRRGYTLVTVSQLLAPARPEPGKIYRP